MHIITKTVPNWQMACLAFSNTYSGYIKSVGLNTLIVRPPLPFPNSMSSDLADQPAED